MRSGPKFLVAIGMATVSGPAQADLWPTALDRGRTAMTITIGSPQQAYKFGFEETGARARPEMTGERLVDALFNAGWPSSQAGRLFVLGADRSRTGMGPATAAPSLVLHGPLVPMPRGIAPIIGEIANGLVVRGSDEGGLRDITHSSLQLQSKLAPGAQSDAPIQNPAPGAFLLGVLGVALATRMKRRFD